MSAPKRRRLNNNQVSLVSQYRDQHFKVLLSILILNFMQYIVFFSILFLLVLELKE